MPNDTPQTTLPERLRALAHIESAALAPQVSAIGQAAREAADEIDRLWAFAQWVADHSNDPGVVREAKRRGAR